MKLGDLVTMPGSWIQNMNRIDEVGLVVALPPADPDGERRQTPRVGILWSGAERIDWEPESWLEVLSESR